jgi:hypothetical protein
MQASHSMPVMDQKQKRCSEIATPASAKKADSPTSVVQCPLCCGSGWANSASPRDSSGPLGILVDLSYDRDWLSAFLIQDDNVESRVLMLDHVVVAIQQARYHAVDRSRVYAIAGFGGAPAPRRATPPKGSARGPKEIALPKRQPVPRGWRLTLVARPPRRPQLQFVDRPSKPTNGPTSRPLF